MILGCLVPGLCFLNLPEQILAAWLELINFVAFAMMGFDKSQAGSGAWRAREKTFWKIAILGGPFGILLGEVAFHHKTQDLAFMAPVYVGVAAWLWVVTRLFSVG